MADFDTVLNFAAKHHGGREAVLKTSLNSQLAPDYAAQPPDRLLSVMARVVFNAGFNWKVIAAKWDGFEAAFEGFDPGKLAFFGDEMLDSLVSDERIVRNGQKIRATLENAVFINEFEREHGSFAAHLAAWPGDDQIGLMNWLGARGSRLGGATVQYFLRFSGWDSWMASPHVCQALVRDGVLDKPAATSKSALAKVQDTMNKYHEDSALPRSQISRLLALSVG